REAAAATPQGVRADQCPQRRSHPRPVRRLGDDPARSSTVRPARHRRRGRGAVVRDRRQAPIPRRPRLRLTHGRCIMTRYGIRSQGSHVRVTYPQGGSSTGITLAKFGGYEPVYKVWLHKGTIAYYAASWLTRTDDPDMREVVKL